jgi:tRNA (cytidine/uridine-2'-O-)-methyltransferase
MPPRLPDLRVALVRPEIHPNTGNIARLCAANGIPLHIVGAPGFRLDERSIRRAGLDYWPHVELHRQRDLSALREVLPQSRFFYFSVRAQRCYSEVSYQPGDCLVFGPESRGLPGELIAANPECALRIPMSSAHVRSLNLATAVAVAVYEALRQLRYGC